MCDERRLPNVALSLIERRDLAESDRAAILALCSRAFNMDYAPLFDTFRDATHILARQDSALVGHALWVMRRLQYAGTLPLLRTAYVEAVAVEDAWRGPLAIRQADQLVPTDENGVMILRLPKTPALNLDAPLSAEWRAGELW